MREVNILMNKNVRKSIFALITSLTLVIPFISIPINVNADTLKIGAAPMVFTDEKIEKGQTRQFEIKIANTSEFAKSLGQSGIDNYTYKVHIEPTEKDLSKYNNISEEQKNLVMASKWVSVENNDFILKPGDMQTVKFLVKVPEKANIGEYLTVLNIEEVPNNINKSNINVNVSSVLQVPLFIDVADPSTKSTGLKENYKIEGFSVSDSLEQTSLLKTFEGLIPFINYDWLNNWKDLASKPYKFSFNFMGTQHIIYDIPKINKSSLEDLLTNDKSKLSDKKYIYVKDKLPLSDLVEKIDFDKNTIIIDDSSNGKQYNIVTPNINICQEIVNQISEFSTTCTTKPTVSELLNNVSLNSSKSEAQNELYLNYKIKNTGTEAMVPKGALLIKKGNEVVDNIQYSSSVIMPGQTQNIIGQLDYSQDTFTAGNNSYSIQSAILPFDGSSLIYKNDTITLIHVRFLIYILFVVLFLLIIFLMSFSIRKLVKKIKIHKSEKILSSV